MFFFFNDTATTEIYTLSLHDALPICRHDAGRHRPEQGRSRQRSRRERRGPGHIDLAFGFPDVQFGRHIYLCAGAYRSEEHTSELQSQSNIVCRLLLETTKAGKITTII